MLNSQLALRAASAAIVLASCLTSAAQADAVSGQGTWETTLQARYFTNDQSKGPDAYYDTALNITWMADANYFKSQYETAPDPSGLIANIISATGLQDGYYQIRTEDLLTIGGQDTSWKGSMTWRGARAWTNTLNVGGVAGWRLPSTIDANSSDSYYLNAPVPADSSELAHLFLTTFGNATPYTSLPSSVINSGPFKNVDGQYFWSGTSWHGWSTTGWALDMIMGSQNGYPTGYPFRAWAVHDGDVGTPAVPEPGTYALMLSGLCALAVMCWHRKRSSTS